MNAVNGTQGMGGGAIYNNGAVTVIDCNFSENTVINVSSHGGAIFSDGGTTLTNCLFIKNNANWGGAIIFFGIYTLTNCNFTNNSAAEGGAIYLCVDSNIESLTIYNCTFRENKASYYGGAIYTDDYSFVVNNCTFIGNTASRGGAVYANDYNLVVNNCNFTENLASSYGGAIYNHVGTLITNDCTFNRNTATYYYGGAIYNSDDANLTGCNFTENIASSFGGAIYNNAGATLNTTNCMFTANIADNNSTGFKGGAIYNNGSAKVTGCNFTEYKYSNYDGPILYNVSPITNCKFNVLINTKLLIVTDVSNDKIIITVTVVDEIVGQKISGKTIYFYVDGKLVGSGTTNDIGVANFTYTSSKSGTYLFDVKIDGFTSNIGMYNLFYSSANASKNVNVYLATVSYQTEITLNTTVSGNKLTITAKTINKNNGQDIIGQIVYFFVNGKQVGSGTTNSTGVATFVYNVSNSGIHTNDAKINGFTIIVSGSNHIYSAASSTKNINVDLNPSKPGLSPSNPVLTPAKLKLDKITTSKPTKKKGKKIYTKTYSYKNIGHITGSKTFNISIGKKFKLSGKITKSGNVIFKYNKKTKKIKVTVKNLAYNKITQVKFKII